MNFEPLADFLEHLTGEIGIPSVDIRIHHNGDEIYRYASGKSYSPDKALHFMYSVTKPVTVTSALKLLEKGKILLDTPLYEIFPEFKNMTVKRKFNPTDSGNLIAQGRSDDASFEDNFEIVPAENPILLRHLFTMTAGFNYNTKSDTIQKYISETNGKFPTRFIAKALSEAPLLFEPGSHWNYSLCHDMLAAVVEEISGKKFSEYVTENIFQPLGMNDSGFVFSDKEAARMTPQFRYDYDRKTADLIPSFNHLVIGSEYESGGAGLISTADDMIKFASALSLGGTAKDGTQILSRRTVELLRSNQLSPALLPDLNWEQLKGYGYALGVRTMINPAAGGSLSPVGEFGWGGAAGSYMMIDPDNRIAVFYAQHMLNNLEPYVHPRIRNIVYSCMNP